MYNADVPKTNNDNPKRIYTVMSLATLNGKSCSDIYKLIYSIYLIYLYQPEPDYDLKSLVVYDLATYFAFLRKYYKYSLTIILRIEK